MTDTPETPEKPDNPPDRLSIDPNSKYFDQDLLERGIGIRFKGKERTDVLEYCISQGWIKVQAGKALDRKGHPLMVELKGPVEAWFDDAASADADSSQGESPEDS